MSKVLITGATGLLGTSLGAWLNENTEHHVTRHGCLERADVNCDMTLRSDVAAMLDEVQPGYIINLAALTDVDACEADPDRAYRLNVRTVENLAAWLTDRRGPRLIHISTDQIYDDGGPHTEGDFKITNTYGFSKVASEIAAAAVDSCILRTNFFGRSKKEGRQSLSDWLLSNLRSQKPFNGFTDVYFSPLMMETLCEMIGLVVAEFVPGVFNLGSKNGVSKAEFASLLASAFDLDDSQMVRTTSDRVGLKTYRPKDMRMDSALFEQTFRTKLPQLSEEVLKLRGCYGKES